MLLAYTNRDRELSWKMSRVADKAEVGGVFGGSFEHRESVATGIDSEDILVTSLAR